MVFAQIAKRNFIPTYRKKPKEKYLLLEVTQTDMELGMIFGASDQQSRDKLTPALY